MLSTVWTILMQKLRFAESIKGKVMILHHFSTVCGRILVPQRRRAFDVFATEISPLLSNSNLVCDKAFQTSYNRILRDLGPLAEEETVTTLYGIIKEKLKSATAGPVLRSLVGLLTKLVSTRRSNFLREVMALSGELEPKIFVLVLDSICAEMVGKSSGESTSVDTDPVESSIIGLLSAASRDATSANIIPSLVSCFSKVKQISISSKYIDEETGLCSSFIEALSQPTTKKILCVPYLNFLASTTVDWWEARDSVWILLNSTDPLTRSAALQAMSHAIKESRADIAVEDMTREVERLLEYFVKFSDEGCTYSLSASLNFFEAVIEKSQSADELLDYLSVFFEVLQKNKTAIANGAVCSALLSLVGKSRQLHKMFYEFVYDNVGSGNAIIRQASLKLLVQWCSHYALPNELSAVELGMFPQECEIQMPSVFLQNTVSILNYLMEEFSRYSLADDKTDFKTICTIYEFLLCANDAYTFTDPQNCAFYALPNLLLEILNYTIEMPVDVFITLLKSISAASSMTGGLTCDGQTMLSGFNIVWNLLHRCASVTDAAGTLELHCEECLLFSHVEMGDHFDATVAAIGEIAFSNKEAF
ncbi:hypothetical protein AGDE_12721 [Angomonas deanei]|uniref:Uncharacterized protein n=1 Tax=Angomonas deanei TaxID=59799 RepID=A0A7G2C551_9TRYP|nr:hypothetical protein AGDE_12721 [Angomonas deanei]CAD2214850.1 hypothetical protein, conserved [Angomonas deanei]|eukprot:EPY23804.1 hypothetical protein AGDE_12721 [Angomonas deanei]